MSGNSVWQGHGPPSPISSSVLQILASAAPLPVTLPYAPTAGSSLSFRALLCHLLREALPDCHPKEMLQSLLSLPCLLDFSVLTLTLSGLPLPSQDKPGVSIL
jgi:hypothetical protein